MWMHSCCRGLGKVGWILLYVVVALEIIHAESHQNDHIAFADGHEGRERQLLGLVQPEPLWLSYRGGSILSGDDLPVYIIWYGRFTAAERSHVLDFFASFKSGAQEVRPSVSSWWALLSEYKDSKGSPIASTVTLRSENFDAYSMGRYLTEDHIEGILQQSLRNAFPILQNAFYLIVTAQDVYVDGFCTQRCASHFTTKQNLLSASPSIAGQRIPFAWVGNAATQCPGKSEGT
jgi:hypothetical protein